jgi:hypothetical protein
MEPNLVFDFGSKPNAALAARVVIPKSGRKIADRPAAA